MPAGVGSQIKVVTVLLMYDTLVAVLVWRTLHPVTLSKELLRLLSFLFNHLFFLTNN